MREILFRGKMKNKADYQLISPLFEDNCKDGFIYGSLVVSKGEYYICISALIALNSLINNGITTIFEVIPETVGQYTGLIDKNGKKIFKGDIIKHFNHFDNPDKYAIYQIEFDERLSKFAGRLHKNWSAQLSKDLEKRYEIIGNIHDNLELLKGGSEE